MPEETTKAEPKPTPAKVLSETVAKLDKQFKAGEITAVQLADGETAARKAFRDSQGEPFGKVAAKPADEADGTPPPPNDTGTGDDDPDEDGTDDEDTGTGTGDEDPDDEFDAS